nr:MAG TPA: hypothetical protein [Caudoviricetes sp.]
MLCRYHSPVHRATDARSLSIHVSFSGKIPARKFEILQTDKGLTQKIS